MAHRPRSVRFDERTRWGAVAAVAVAILFASLLPNPTAAPTPVGPLGVPLDKWVHAGGYACLGGVAGYAFRSRGLVPAVLGGIFLGVVFYGVGIEFLQALVPTRSPDWLDALANAVGAAVAVAGWHVSVRSSRDRRATG